MASPPNSSAVRALHLELKKLTEEPVEGFLVNVPDDCNLFEWDVAIFGPPGTHYEGGYFKVSKENRGTREVWRSHFCGELLGNFFLFLTQAHMSFPQDYPYSPPTFRFLTKMWHPNIYEVYAFIRHESHLINPSILTRFHFSPLLGQVRGCLYFNTSSTRWWSPKRWTSLGTLEPYAER